jgi:hypothetical protein
MANAVGQRENGLKQGLGNGGSEIEGFWRLDAGGVFEELAI